MVKKDMEHRSQVLQRERDAAQKEKDAAQREKERFKQERDSLCRYNITSGSHNIELYFHNGYGLTLHFVFCSEKVSLEKSIQAAQNSNQTLQMDCEKLQLAVASMQRERDHERKEKETIGLERDRAKAETQRL